MSLTEEMVMDYLVKVRSLKAINNHEVKDSHGSKTGQMPLTIKIGKDLIDQILDEGSERNQAPLTEKEIDSLYGLKEALDSLPISMNFQSIWSAVMEVDQIQKTLMDSVTVYLANISQFEEHELLLKAVVLVLKIVEYDLSKKPGPITYGYGFFQLEVLSNEQRIENHARAKKLLADIIERFDTSVNTMNLRDVSGHNLSHL